MIITQGYGSTLIVTQGYGIFSQRTVRGCVAVTNRLPYRVSLQDKLAAKVGVEMSVPYRVCVESTVCEN